MPRPRNLTDPPLYACSARTQAEFDQAVKEVRVTDGPIKPTLEDQKLVSQQRGAGYDNEIMDSRANRLFVTLIVYDRSGMMDRPLHRFRNPYHITLTIYVDPPPRHRTSIPPSSHLYHLTPPLSPTLLLPNPQFYGLFKQANEGDVNTPKPGMMQFTERGKWTAWESQKGKSEENAKKEYVQALFAVSLMYPRRGD